MCGRSSQRTDLNKLARRWDLKQRDLPQIAPRYNLGPGQEAVTVARRPEGPRIEPMFWGIPLQSPSGKLLFNLRLETLRKGSFRSALLQRRCLFPVDGFYEWQKAGKLRIPIRFVPKGDDLFVMPGIYEEARPDGPPRPTFTIFTTEPNELVGRVHNRMPIILKPEDELKWLDPGATTPEPLLSLLGTFPADRMESFEVSSRLNSGREEGPQLIQPVKTPRPPEQRNLF